MLRRKLVLASGNDKYSKRGDKKEGQGCLVLVGGKCGTTFGQRKEQAEKSTKEGQGESSHAFIVENRDTSKRTIDTSRKTKVLRTMSNPERFLKKRVLQPWLQVQKSFCSFAANKLV